LPTDRLQRKKQPGKRSDLPFVISVKAENALRVYALDLHASRLGLRLGQALANARAMAPHIEVVEADETADKNLLEQIADWCDRFTPFVSIDPPHGLLLDVTGVTHLFGGERAMLDAVQSALRKQSFSVCAALAGTSGAACALSRYAPNTIVEPGFEAEALAALPIAALNCVPKAEHALRRAGLKTIGQVAGRRRTELTSRFGREFTFLLDHVLGRSDKPISPRRPLPDFAAECRFAEPVLTEAVIVDSLERLALQLGKILEERGKGARKLEAAFFRADGAVRRIVIETGTPTRDPKIIARLFRLKIDMLADPIDPGFGFDLIRLEATLAQTDDPETAALGKSDREEREIDQLIDSLSARFGPQRVLRFHMQDTHIPEAEVVLLPAQFGKPESKWETKRAPDEMPRRPLRLLSRPEPISVMAQIPDGPPLRFRWRSVLHTAVFAAGPESIAMEWWRHQDHKPERDYFRVEDETGRRYWLYRDGQAGDSGKPALWYMHGLFA
jgi:protein ImuB